MSQTYESPQMLADYLLFHFGEDADVMPWEFGPKDALQYPARCAQLCKNAANGHAKRVLDLGCAVGRSTFEMARHCERVVGIDYSHAFIAAAETLRTHGGLTYERREEATLATPLVARRSAEVDAAKVEFHQGDAMNLPAAIGSFDRVHAANLLCRLREPLRLIERLPRLVNPGGELVLATPCTWLEDFTPRENWPQADTLGWLKSSLAPAFRLVRQADEPFLIRETARKFQWTTALVTVWQRHV